MGRRHKSRRSPVSRRVETLLELPDGVLGHCTHMELTDNRQLQMDGCCEILEYEEDLVRVAVAGGSVRFLGRAFRLTCLTATSILLTGELLSIEFSND